MILIGLTGTHGAGKGTVVEYLVERHRFFYASVSEFLADEAERRGLTRERKYRSQIANELRAEDPMLLIRALFESAQAQERAIVEPLYTKNEVAFIHEKKGHVIGVDADLALRYRRITERGSPKDQVSFEEFAAFQQQEMQADDPNAQNTRATLALADHVIMNNSTLDDLHEQVDVILQKIGV